MALTYNKQIKIFLQAFYMSAAPVAIKHMKLFNLKSLFGSEFVYYIYDNNLPQLGDALI
jgi:hypothetical protein